MDVKDFRRIVSCFSESPANFAGADGEFVLQTIDETIAGRFVKKEGVLFVEEEGVQVLAESWIVRRISKLHVLADRILSFIPEPENFVDPDANYLPDLEASIDEQIGGGLDAKTLCLRLLSRQTPGTTQVAYLTSDAGEGKTTLILKLARSVAERYKRREIDWILLPVPLGGRAFLRFDEAVLAALMGRYRFQYWFFEGFIELVRMGVVIPAFDGFEEMIVENSSGEAVSALGALLSQLESEGKVLFAARRAFFEYQSFRTQARLFDAIGSEESVAFSRVSLNRWSRKQFEAYALRRQRGDGPEIFDAVSARLGEDHPLLTRAVLVRRLFDVAKDVAGASALVLRLGGTPQDYFHSFVFAIIEREASEKWRDKADQNPLLTLDEHGRLLAAVAREMWVSGSDTLRGDILDLVADLFCEETKKSPAVARQVRERLAHHALLVKVGSVRPDFAFDHEDFKQFFLGLTLNLAMRKLDVEQVRSLLRTALLPAVALDEAVLTCLGAGGGREKLLDMMRSVIGGELPTSFVPENAGNLLIRILDGMEDDDLSPQLFEGFVFSPNSLVGRQLSSVRFLRCYFGPTPLDGTVFHKVAFDKSTFERIEVGESNLLDSTLTNCEVMSVVLPDGESVLYDPESIKAMLSTHGLQAIGAEAAVLPPSWRDDDRLEIVSRVMRIFMRATQHNEGTLRMKLGVDAPLFFDTVLPELLRLNILALVSYRGAGVQRRFRLSKPMSEIQVALSNAQGRFENFCDSIAQYEK